MPDPSSEADAREFPDILTRAQLDKRNCDSCGKPQHEHPQGDSLVFRQSCCSTPGMSAQYYDGVVFLCCQSCGAPCIAFHVATGQTDA